MLWLLPEALESSVNEVVQKTMFCLHEFFYKNSFIRYKQVWKLNKEKKKKTKLVQYSRSIKWKFFCILLGISKAHRQPGSTRLLELPEYILTAWSSIWVSIKVDGNSLGTLSFWKQIVKILCNQILTRAVLWFEPVCSWCAFSPELGIWTPGPMGCHWCAGTFDPCTTPGVYVLTCSFQLCVLFSAALSPWRSSIIIGSL